MNDAPIRITRSTYEQQPAKMNKNNGGSNGKAQAVQQEVDEVIGIMHNNIVRPPCVV